MSCESLICGLPFPQIIPGLCAACAAENSAVHTLYLHQRPQGQWNGARAFCLMSSLTPPPICDHYSPYSRWFKCTLCGYPAVETPELGTMLHCSDRLL